MLLAAALLLGLVLLWMRAQRRPAERPLPKEWALTPRPVFSTDERRLYRQLREALPHHVVLSKLPLVRFCQPTNPKEVRYWYEMLGGSHVSFASCSASGRVLVALDIETERGTSRRSLQIKHAVLGACRVRYLRCAPDALPSIPELQALVPRPVVATAPPQSPVTQTRERLASTVASRRQQRANLWQDSAFSDSRYAPLMPPAGAMDETTGFGSLSSSGFGSLPMPLRH